MKSFLALIVASYLVASVYGHAKLVSPVAFNPNPSKTAPCGGGALPSGAAANWPVGSTQTVSWTQVASDGGGQLSMYIDPKGSTDNFMTTTTGAGTGLVSVNFPYSTNANDNYQFTLTVPDVDCNGPSGLCSVVIFTATSWWACTLVTIKTSNVIQPVLVANTTVANCTNATALAFCDIVNGHVVSIPTGQTPAQLDASAQSAYTSTLANAKVLSTPSKPGCASALKYLLCSTLFKSCDYHGPSSCDYYKGGSGCFCVTTCIQAAQLCGLNATHVDLFGCGAATNYALDATTGSCTLLDNYFGSAADNTTTSVPQNNSAGSVYATFVGFFMAVVTLFL
jgi:hypothetical protein